MWRLIATAAICVVLGVGIGLYVVPLIDPVRTARSATDPAETVFIKWPMASTYPSELIQFGTLGRKFVNKLKRASGGQVEFIFKAPGSVVAPEGCFDAVSKGVVNACWSSPVHWVGKERALSLFASVPFGPDAREYAAWYYYGGGEQLMEQIYARHNIKSLICGVAAPEAGGWFKKPITSLDDLKGLRMRFFGLGARVMRKLGVVTLRIKGSDIVKALRDGRIDATEYSMPAIDVGLGIDRVAKYYYFPGWHRQATLLEVMINKSAWDALPPKYKAMIDLACGDNFREGMAEGGALQTAALRQLEARGVKVRTWPPDVLAALRKAWAQVAEEEAATDPDFRRVWESYKQFRAEYRRWKKVGHLK